MKLKCLYCGCEKEFVGVSLFDCWIAADAGEIRQKVQVLACTECGFIQMFDADKVQVNSVLETRRKEEEAKQRELERQEKIKKLNKEIADTKAIIGDENQTVKVVREAQEKLRRLEEQLSELGRRFRR